MTFFAISLQIYWRKFFGNVCWVGLYQTYTFCPNLSIWLVGKAIQRINLHIILKKSTPQKLYGGWSWNFAEMFIALVSTKIFFFFFFFFYCCCICTLVVMATSSFHGLIMGKMKIGFNCWLIADIWTERFKNRLLSSFPPSRQICKLLILICCHCHSF